MSDTNNHHSRDQANGNHNDDHEIDFMDDRLFGKDRQRHRFSQDDDTENDDDEVMRLAARLAPAFEDALDLFQVPAEFQRQASSSGDSGTDNDGDSDIQRSYGTSHEDDDLKHEISDLERSEELLRQEMEQANLFSKLVMSTIGETSYDEYQDDDVVGGGESPQMLVDSNKTVAQSPPSTSSPLMSPSSNHSPSVSEADIGSSDLDTPEQNLELPPIDEENHVVNQTPSASNRKLKEQQQQMQQQQQQMQRSMDQQTASPTRSNSAASIGVPATAPIVAMGRTPVAYDLQSHQHYLQVTIENGWYMVNLNRFLLPPSLSKLSSQLPSMSEYCISCPENRLKNWYIGFVETSSSPSSDMRRQQPHHPYTPAPLPVRTSVIRIRPDVLCGAVMDAVVTATTTLIDTEPQHFKDHSILRRQGGHLQLVLTTTTDEQQFMVDLQLCTHKSNHCPRVLIVRIFRCLLPSDTMEVSAVEALSTTSRNEGNDVAPIPDACLHLREACALVQRMEIEATNVTGTSRQQIKFRPAQSPSMSDQDAITQAFGKHLRKTYKACPSTSAGNITLPALNNNDWKLLQASWVWVDEMWQELDSRSLTYSSLATTRFGGFPCLPTLDNHYCSQIRKYSRETMIVQLLKSATQLEEYARDAEYACANVIALLRKAFIEYDVDPPPLPVAIPLTSYPLEHASPQGICPPWGLAVMEALNQVQVWVDDAGKNKTFSLDRELPQAEIEASVQESTNLAARAVASVVAAFQKQDDEEKGARLQRKNRQVMERLSVMRKHQTVSVDLLDQCTSDCAQRAADDLNTKSNIREVPLLKCGVVAGSTTGTCIITRGHIVFITQFLPLLGMGQKVKVFSLKDVDFELVENAPVFLKALPTIISLEQDGKEVYSFRPSAGGVRIKNFLDIVKSIACESKSVLSS